MGQCNAERFRVNKLRMQRVAHYSFACLKEIAGADCPSISISIRMARCNCSATRPA